MANPATRISIYADDRASAVMRTVARESETLCRRIEDLGKNATKYFFAFQAGFTGVSGIGGFLKDTAFAAARYETLGAAMDRAGENVGKSRAEMAAFEAQLVRNGIALNESREILTRLAASNVDLAKASQLARTAQDLAVVSNTNSSQALQTLVHGIISAQPEMLRTLGLAVNFEGAYAKAAQSMGKSAAGLTEAEKLQIRMNAALEAGSRYAGIYETTMQYAGKQLGSFTRHWENLKTLAGGFALDTLSMSVFGVNESLDGMNKRLMDMKASGEMAEYSKNIAEAMRGLAGNIDLVLVAGGSYIVFQRLLQSETLKSVAASARLEVAQLQGRAVILGSAEALKQKALAQEADALAAVNATRALIAKTQAELASAVAVKGAAMNEGTRAGILHYVETLQMKLVADEARYAAAVNATAAASARASVGARALASMRAGVGGLVSLLGGPWGIALMAASIGVGYLATAQSDAENAAEAYGTSLDAIDERYKKLSQGAEQAALDTAKLTESHRQAIEREMQLTVDAAKKQMEAAQKALQLVSKGAAWVDFDPFSGMSIERFGQVDKAFVAELQSIIATLNKEGAAYALEAETRLRNLRTEATNAAESLDSIWSTADNENRNFAELITLAITHVSAFGQSAEKVDTVTASLEKTTTAAQGTASALNALANVNFDSLLSNVDFEIGKVGLTDRNRAIVDGLMRSKAVDQSKIAIQGGSFDISGLTPEAEAQVEKYAAALGRLHDRQQAARKGGKDLQTALASLNDELAKITLTEQEYARYQFERKFAELRKDLKSTTPALAEWAAIQQMAFGAGYTGADALATHIRDVAKAIGEIGLDEKEKQIRAVNEEFAKLFAYMDAGGKTPFSRDEAEALQADRVRQAQTGKTDKQLQVEFEKEFLNVMRGSEAEQLASIAERAAAYQQAGADAVRVAQWQSEMELKYSREATAGMQRSLKVYADDATNAAKNIESVLTNSFSSMEDALVEFATTGKLSFSDMVNSMISDLMRLMIRQSITGPLAKALTGWISGEPAPGTPGSPDFVGPVQPAGVRHSGGMVSIFGTHDTYPASLFANAPRYHDGGPILAKGEVPIIAQIGERVLSREEARAYGKPSVNNIIINTPPGMKAETRQKQNPSGGEDTMIYFKEMVQGVVAQDISSRRGPVSKALDMRGM